MSEIDTRIENMEAELAALKAAREAEKAPFRIQGPVYVGQVFKARNGEDVIVKSVHEAATWSTCRDHKGGYQTLGFSAQNGPYSYGYEDSGRVFNNRESEWDIVSQAIGVKMEVGGVYRSRDGIIAIATRFLGDGYSYPYEVKYLDSCEDVISETGRESIYGGDSGRDLVRKIGTVNLDA